MRSAHRILAATAVVALGAFGAAASAQTQKFTRPAPTAADWAAIAKLPDFTGVWEVTLGRPGGRGRGGRGAPGARGDRAGGPPPGPSLTPAYAAKRAERLKNAPEDNQTANCLPPGMPGIMGQPYPMEFLLTPGQVTIDIEAYSQVRHIYTDGRPLPDDPDPNFFGSSIGHWEGHSLVAETIGFSPQTELERGVPHGDKMHIVERFTLVDPDTMTIETTITDPDALAAPWVTTRTLKRHRTWTIAEYICEQNNRNSVDENGKAHINIQKD
jgi:hypothetical protein